MSNSLKKNAALNMTKNIMGLIFPLVTFPYVSRVLEPDGVGKVNFAHSIISYFSMIAALGINTYGVREAARLRNDKIKLTKFVKEILTINIISTLVAYCLLGFALICIPKFSDYRLLLVVCSGSILFATIGIDWLYTALEEFSYITIRSILFQMISIVLMFIFVRQKEDYLIYAGIGVVSSVGSNICNFIHARTFILFKEKIKKQIKKHMKPIFTLFAMSIAISIYTALDTTMLGFISGDEQVGFYTAATRINKIVVSVITAAVAVILPRLSYYLSQNDRSNFNELIEKALKIVILFSLPCAVGLCLVAKPVVLLFSGLQYEPAIVVMQVMNPIIIAISLSGFIGIQVFMPMGKERVTLLTVIVGAIVNFSLNMVLIPKYGALGAGIATVFAECIVTIVQLIYAHNLFEWNKVFPHILQCVIATCFMSIVVYFFLKINLQFILQLLGSVLIGTISYGSALLLMRNQFCISIIKEHKK